MGMSSTRRSDSSSFTDACRPLERLRDSRSRCQCQQDLRECLRQSCEHWPPRNLSRSLLYLGRRRPSRSKALPNNAGADGAGASDEAPPLISVLCRRFPDAAVASNGGGDDNRIRPNTAHLRTRRSSCRLPSGWLAGYGESPEGNGGAYEGGTGSTRPGWPSAAMDHRHARGRSCRRVSFLTPPPVASGASITIPRKTSCGGRRAWSRTGGPSSSLSRAKGQRLDPHSPRRPSRHDDASAYTEASECEGERSGT